MVKINEISIKTPDYASEAGSVKKNEFINSVYGNKPKNTETEDTPVNFHDLILGKVKASKITLYGVTHYKYQDCLKEDLVKVGNERLHKKCATQFTEMQKAAQKDGVTLYIVGGGGFRSSEYQKTVFKKKFIDKNNPTPEEMKSRIRFSAPSGFSEHSTGLAVDMNSLSQNFENTKAYKWLKANAAKYGFENSFPRNNKQGLGYEPWHWRYVGDEECAKVFEQARNNE